MDDLEFRRQVYADPKDRSPSVKAACQSDPAKAQFVEDMQTFDRQIKRALTVDAPDNLAERIILNQSLGEHAVQRKKSRIQLAMAASVAFALGISFTLWNSSTAYADIGEHALAHVYHEQSYFDNGSQQRVNLQQVNMKLAEYNAEFVEGSGELLSAEFCRFGGNRSLHLTYKGIDDVVSVFIVPASESLAFVEQFNDENYVGMAQLSHQHHIIIVGNKREPLQDWQQNIDKSIRWSI